jgi:HlyD family secretion protein
VQRGDLRVTVSATGNLQPTNKVEVGSELSGLVTEVGVDNNDQVTRGQVLARLDTSRLHDTIAQSRAALQSAQAGVAQAHATAQQTQAALGADEAVTGGAASAAEFDTASGNRSARAAVQTAEFRWRRHGAAVVRPDPFESTDQVPGHGSNVATPRQTVAASFNADFVIAKTCVVCAEVKWTRPTGRLQKAGDLPVDAFPGRSATVSASGVQTLAKLTGTTSSAGSVVYTASVENAGGILCPGMTATAEIVTSEKRNVLLVPNAALRFSPGGADGAQDQQRGGVTSVLIPMRPRGTSSGQKRDVGIGRGSAQTVHVLGPTARTGARTMATPMHRPSERHDCAGALVITGQLQPSAADGRRIST